MGDEDFAHAERRWVAEHFRFLVCELEDPDVAEELAVEIVVEAQWPDLRHAHEALPIERNASPSRKRGDRLQWELAACKRSDVHPAPRRQLRDVARLPHVAEGVDRHRP